MSLFRKKNKEEKVSCCCNGGCDAGVNAVSDVKIESIKVLGAGCKSCHEQYQNVINAAAEMGLATDIEYITDMEKVMTYEKSCFYLCTQFMPQSDCGSSWKASCF